MNSIKEIHAKLRKLGDKYPKLAISMRIHAGISRLYFEPLDYTSQQKILKEIEFCLKNLDVPDSELLKVSGVDNMPDIFV